MVLAICRPASDRALRLSATPLALRAMTKVSPDDGTPEIVKLYPPTVAKVKVLPALSLAGL